MDNNPEKLDDSKLDKLTELTETKPTQALIYGMGLVILFLVSACWFFIYRANNIEAKVTEGVDERIEKEVAKQIIPYVKQAEKLEAANAILTKKNEDLTERYIASKDATAEKQAKEYQLRIDKFETTEAKRDRISKKRENIIERTENKINTLEHVTKPANEN